MNPPEVDAAEAMRERLQADLRLTLKRQAAFEVAILRVLIAALDNAGAVPLSRALRGHTEIERRRLNADDDHDLLWREHEPRRAAAGDYARLGKHEHSERAGREMTTISRYLAKAAPAEP